MAATLAGLALVPTWITDFLEAVKVCQGSIGKTGAEAVFGQGSIVTSISAGVVVLFGVVLAIRALRERSQDGLLLTFAYLPVAQAFALQYIHHATIMAISGVFLALRFSGLASVKDRRIVSSLLIAALVMITVSQWSGFLTILGPAVPLLATVR